MWMSRVCARSIHAALHHAYRYFAGSALCLCLRPAQHSSSRWSRRVCVRASSSECFSSRRHCCSKNLPYNGGGATRRHTEPDRKPLGATRNWAALGSGLAIETCAITARYGRFSVPKGFRFGVLVAGRESRHVSTVTSRTEFKQMVRRLGGGRSMAVFPRSGAHDLGGMEGLGPVPIEADEAPWHEVWEGRTLGATLAAVLSGMLVPPTHRAVIEALHPVTYL